MQLLTLYNCLPREGFPPCLSCDGVAPGQREGRVEHFVFFETFFFAGTLFPTPLFSRARFLPLGYLTCNHTSNQTNMPKTKLKYDVPSRPGGRREALKIINK